MTPQLEHLISLWNSSLEGSASRAESAELQALLKDADLSEQLAQWQAEHATAEPETALSEAQWASLDANAKAAFARFKLMRRARGPVLIFAGLAAALSVWAFWPAKVDSTPGVRVIEKPFAVRERGESQAASSDAVEASTPKRQLSAPPVNGASVMRVSPAGQGIRIDVLRKLQGPLSFSVVRQDGSLVKELWNGQTLNAGQAISWNGLSADGSPASRGSYKLRLVSASLRQDRSFQLEER